jgi:hypothetical protein
MFLGDAAAAAIENFAFVLDFPERFDDAGERLVRLRGGDAALSHENLPQAGERLEGSGGIRPQRLVADFIEGVNGVEVGEDGFVGEGGRLGKHWILG